MLHIYIDADACPVKDEVYRVAKRCGLSVTLVANCWMRAPNDPSIRLEVVDDAHDAADDWIAEHAEANDIVITADIPLAERCLANDAHVIGPKGKLFDQNNIGGAVATRDLMEELRSAGEVTGGPPPMTPKDRSQFLQKLDQVIQKVRRKHPADPA